MGVPEIFDILFFIAIGLLILLGAWNIIWKWRYEKRFEACVTDGESCLRVRCVPARLRAPGLRRLILAVVPLVSVSLLGVILMMSDSPFFWKFIFAWIVATEIFILCIQSVLLGQIMNLGPHGICYPEANVGPFASWIQNKKTRKLASMQVAAIDKNKITAPWCSVLKWEWPEEGDQLSLTLEARSFLKSRPQQIAFVFPCISDSERRAISKMLRKKTRISV